MRPRSGKITWGVAFGVLLIAGAVVGFLRRAPADQLDYDLKNVVSYSVAAGSLLFLAAWFLFRSRLSNRWKWGVTMAAVAAVGLFFLAFRLENFSGDMNFRFVARFAPTHDETLTTLDARPVETPADDLISPGESDFPQFLGPNRAAKVAGVQLATDWQTNPPREVWRRPIGAGWSGFAVVGNMAVTQEQRGEQELVVAYQLETGDIMWSHADKGRFSSLLGGDGPRATPTIHDGKCYTQGALGVLNCLNAATGRKIWSRNIIQENGAEVSNWGQSGSPLVVDHLVIVSAGGPDGKSLIAYHKDTGEPVWSSGSDRASYASPVLAEIGGERQVLSVNENYVVGHRLSDGQERWRYAWPGKSDSNANTSQPVAVGGDRVFLSKGYGHGSALIQLTGHDQDQFAVEVLWREQSLMKTKMTNVVVDDGYVYGLSGGILECVELDTGRRQWKRGRYGHGQILLVGDLLLITAENGDIALIGAGPEKYQEVARFKALDDKTWNTPALAGYYLLVRNHREAACYALPTR